MRISIVASHGTRPTSLVALQNIVLKLDRQSDISVGQEPEVDKEDLKVRQRETSKVLF